MIKYFPVVRASYESSNAIQQKLSRKLLDFKNQDPATRHQIPPMALFAYEIEPTYTLGRRQRGSVANSFYESLKLARESRGATIYETLRGGHTTFHGPGQLVLYPVLDLQRLNVKIRDYVCVLEKSIVSVLHDHYQINAEQRPGSGFNGVWIREKPQKIASVGVHIRRNVTSHGLALNVDMDPFWFQQIVACNLPNAEMVSIADINLGTAPSLNQIGEQLANEIAKRLSISLEYETEAAHYQLLDDPKLIAS